MNKTINKQSHFVRKNILIALSMFVSLQMFCLDKSVADFKSVLASRGETEQVFDYLYDIYREYESNLINSATDSANKESLYADLSEIHPYLLRGVLYFTGKNNNKAVNFANAYLEVLYNENMQGYDLAMDSNLYTIICFAGINDYKAQKYDKAITYLTVYISSGEVQNLASAFNYLGKAYMGIGNPTAAVQALEQGLALYPNDMSIILSMIDVLDESRLNDVALNKYLTTALTSNPENVKAMEIQGRMYERNQDFEDAAKTYAKLYKLKPQDLEIKRHLAMNYYNTGLWYHNTETPNSRQKQSEKYLLKAASLLEEVWKSDPMAKSYPVALAHTYNLLNNYINLEKVNRKIIAFGQQPVAKGSVPMYMEADNDHVSLVANLPAVESPVMNVPVPAREIPRPVVKKVPEVNPTIVPAEPRVPVKQVADVDENIPYQLNSVNENTFAVIIANSAYQKVQYVDNAENDGKIFAEYCKRTLGIPEAQIRRYNNVTYGDLLDAIEDIKTISHFKKGDLNILFYYVGHGIPNEETKTGYILPVDADSKQIRVCYPLQDLYTELAQLNANNTVVFLDACFSGANINDGGRGVAIDEKKSEVEGKVIVFSAASGDEKAFSLNEKKHGLFTYYLLKKLKDTKGSVNLGTLADYLYDNVGLESQLQNRKRQTPTVLVGSGYDDTSWKNITLNK